MSSVRIITILLISVIMSCPSIQAQVSSSADSTIGDMFFMTDSLNARHAGQGLSDGGPPDRNLAGRFQVGRTLTPLNHAGANVFQQVLDSPGMLDAVRSLKSNAAWSPFTSGGSGNTAYNYHYDADGSEKASYFAGLSVEKPLIDDSRIGFFLQGRYDDQWGPFPDQRSSMINMTGGISLRLTSATLVSVNFLGMDNGWHFNRGNRVYTDRSKFMLEQMNTWRARTGGVEAVWRHTYSQRLSFRIYGRIVNREWASDPRDPSLIRLPSHGDVLPITQPQPTGVPPEHESYVNNVYPVVNTVVTASRRSFGSIKSGIELNRLFGSDNRFTAGFEFQKHRMRFFQHWQTSTHLDRFDQTVMPYEISLYYKHAFRFWRLMMSTGLRYDRYNPGTSGLSQVIRASSDTRSVETSTRQILLGTGPAESVHLLNPSLSVAYPTNRFTAHMNFGISSRSLTLADRYSGTGTAYADRTLPSPVPRRTTSLEAGLSRVNKAYSADISLFYRDTERYEPIFGPDVLPQTLSNYAGTWSRVNYGWRRQKGIEAVYAWRNKPALASGIRLSGRLSYLYLFDLGAVRRRDLPVSPASPINPGDLTTFDARINHFWNRRHWIAANATLRMKSALTVSFVAHLQSGTPYLGSIRGISGSRIQKTMFGPWMRRFDGRADIPVRFGGRIPTFSVFIEGRNLTNQTIIDVVTDPNTFDNTGKPDNDTVSQTQWVYGAARSLWTGISLNW